MTRPDVPLSDEECRAISKATFADLFDRLDPEEDKDAFTVIAEDALIRAGYAARPTAPSVPVAWRHADGGTYTVTTLAGKVKEPISGTWEGPYTFYRGADGQHYARQTSAFLKRFARVPDPAASPTAEARPETDDRCPICGGDCPCHCNEMEGLG